MPDPENIAPARIQQLSAPELKAMIDSGATFEFVDVRTPHERELACIEGTRLLDQAYLDHLLTLDRDTPIVFQCHHGMRSQSAAEYVLGHGFRNLYNLSGGIDAWSRTVDPSVPLYCQPRHSHARLQGCNHANHDRRCRVGCPLRAARLGAAAWLRPDRGPVARAAASG